MAKTYNHLFEQVYAFDALYAAYLRARKGKREHLEVRQFEADLEGNLIQLQNELIWDSYKTGSYRHFKVHEPKTRDIAALPFRDRVVQHALVAAIEPIWEARFIANSYACRINKGTHKGADKAQEMLRLVFKKGDAVYAFKADIAQYFASIDHAILKILIRKRIACTKTLSLCDNIIDSNQSYKGIPIGNLTSQLFANIYLHELDLFVKHQLKEQHYMRYMDDFIIIHHDKTHLQRVRLAIEDFLMTDLKLKTNAKTQVFPVAVKNGRSLDFLGYKIWLTHRKIRKNSAKRITRKLKIMQKRYATREIGLIEIEQSIRSWIAHANHANSNRVIKDVLCRFVFTRPSD